MAQPEHALQTQACKFARICIAVPHVFLAFDRSAKQSALQHVREKARGLRAGTADTLTLIERIPPAWVELKAGSNKPSDLQIQFGTDVQGVGCYWGWANSIEGVRQCWIAAGVPLRPNAAIVAAHLDALLASAAIRKSGKAPRSYRARPEKGSAARIAAGNRGALFTGRGVE